MTDSGRGGAPAWSGRAANVALAIGLLAAAGCTLSLDISAVQCRRNEDCARFDGAVCDTGAQVCKRGPGQDAGSGGANGGGSAGADGGAGGRLDAGSTNGSGDGEIMSGDAVDHACRAGDDCVACGPAAFEDSLQNRCTDVTCVPFDNRARLTNLGVNGTLMPLPGQAP